MEEGDLVNWIVQSSKKGYTLEQLKDILTKQGADKNSINLAITKALPQITSPVIPALITPTTPTTTPTTTQAPINTTQVQNNPQETVSKPKVKTKKFIIISIIISILIIISIGVVYTISSQNYSSLLSPKLGYKSRCPEGTTYGGETQLESGESEIICSPLK